MPRPRALLRRVTPQRSQHYTATHSIRSSGAVGHSRLPCRLNSMIGLTSVLYRTYSLLARPYRLLCPHTRPYTTATSTAAATPPPSADPSHSSGASGESIDAAEVGKFSAMSDSWWDVNGEFCLLHRMNPTRVQFIRDHTARHLLPLSLSLSVVGEGVWPLRGLDVLDVGCGGGLLTESLCRLGGRVIGIDASAPNIAIATQHAALDPTFAELASGSATAGASLSASSALLVYRNQTAEQLLASSNPPPQFDVVCSLEVVEHVANPEQFVATLAALVRPGGLLFLSTINRTALSYLLTIGVAEYALGWVSRGTHDWHKYVTPAELQQWVEADTGGGGEAMEVLDVNGMLYDPLWRRWSLDANRTEVNYILCARKRTAQSSSAQ